jgi:hypothetical protein
MKPLSLVCPTCNSTRLRRSHSRGLYEYFLKLFNQRAYRCKDCGWRGRIKAKKRRERKTTFTIGQAIGIIIAPLVVIYIAIYLVNRSNENAEHQTPAVSQVDDTFYPEKAQGKV